MKVVYNFFMVVVITLSFVSCAGSYRQLDLKDMEFRNAHVSSNVEFSYRYDVLTNSNNKRYASYEKDENICVVAVKIKNNADHDISVNDNTLKVYAGTNQLTILEPKAVADQMHQNTYPYFLYSLLFLNIYNGTSVTTIPIGIPIALINFFRAKGANDNFEGDLVKLNVMNREVKKGETLTGILSLYNAKYDALRFEFFEQIAEQKNIEADKNQIETQKISEPVQSTIDTLGTK